MTGHKTTHPTRTGPTTTERLATIHADLVEGIEATRSEAGWQMVMKMAKSQPRWSLRNQILAAMQAPEATLLMSFGSWKKLGRPVSKGEHAACYILEPVTYKAKNDEVETPSEPQPAEGDPAAKVLRGFKPGARFDISQTDGPPLPDISPQLLTGDAPSELWVSILDQISAQGYRLDIAEMTDRGGAKGITLPRDKRVIIRCDMEPLQMLKTATHELAHILLGHVDSMPDYAAHRGRAETEAESVAYLVLGAYRIDSSTYSFRYVASWATDTKVVEQAAARAIKTAEKIIDAIELPSMTQTLINSMGAPLVDQSMGLER